MKQSKCYGMSCIRPSGSGIESGVGVLRFAASQESSPASEGRGASRRARKEIYDY
jgi:hypothetical protein